MNKSCNILVNLKVFNEEYESNDNINSPILVTMFTWPAAIRLRQPELV
jgi:hypothetical protein